MKSEPLFSTESKFENLRTLYLNLQLANSRRDRKEQLTEGYSIYAKVS